MVRFVIVVLTLSAFGPYLTFGSYLTSGLRTDQIVVYGATALLAPFTIWNLRPTGAQLAMLGAWVMMVAVAAIGWAGGGINTSPWPRGSAAATADNLALPVATALLVLMVAPRRSAAVRDVAVAMVALGAGCSALVALGQYLAPTAVQPMLSGWFWGEGDTGERALTVGRYTGLFGQPSVAGALYSLGVVCAIYALRHRRRARALVVGVVILGGVLSLSKAFLLVGLPISVWQLWRTARGRWGQRAALLLSGLCAYAAVTSLGLFDEWSGTDRLLSLLPGRGGSVGTYTGNRYGDDSSTAPIVDATLGDHPISGYGLSSLNIYTDTAYVYALVIAGLIGVACVAVVAVVPLVAFWRNRSDLTASERLLSGGVILVLSVSSLGLPVYTANRLSVLAWMLLVLLVPSSTRKGEGRAQDREPSVALHHSVLSDHDG